MCPNLQIQVKISSTQTIPKNKISLPTHTFYRSPHLRLPNQVLRKNYQEEQEPMKNIHLDSKRSFLVARSSRKIQILSSSLYEHILAKQTKQERWINWKWMKNGSHTMKDSRTNYQQKVETMLRENNQKKYFPLKILKDNQFNKLIENLSQNAQEIRNSLRRIFAVRGKQDKIKLVNNIQSVRRYFNTDAVKEPQLRESRPINDYEFYKPLQIRGNINLNFKLYMDKAVSLNFRVIEKDVKNLQKILFSLPYAILARYDVSCSLWTYLTFKGPLFLVEDKQKQKKLVILNQCQLKNYIFTIQDFYQFQLVNVDGNGYMLNYMFEDTISGLNVFGIWSADENLKKRFKKIIQT